MTIRDKFEEMKEHHEGRKEYRHELRDERKLEHELKHDVKKEIKDITKQDKELGHEIKREAKADYKEFKKDEKEAEKYAKGKAWTRIIWDVTAVAWLLDGDFEEDYLVHSPIPGYDNHYVLDPQRHFIRYVYHVKRDSLFTDLFAKLGRS